MREIKFRAWYKSYKKMVHDFLITETGVRLGITFNGEVFCFDDIEINGEDSMVGGIYKDRFELMQFTGLKDKNGIDIYESDIVIVKYCDNGDSYTETVTVTNTNGKGYSPFNLESSCDGCDCNLEINSIEVIGNIHQHIHLLELPK